jgi:hypothetical protein
VAERAAGDRPSSMPAGGPGYAVYAGYPHRDGSRLGDMSNLTERNIKFEVIAGQSVPENRDTCCVGPVHAYRSNQTAS